MRHELKTDPHVFDETWNGTKLYEIRKDDRPRPDRTNILSPEGFLLGDELLLRETRYSSSQMQGGRHLEYTGREVLCEVVQKLMGYGLEPGWCILGIKRLELIDKKGPHNGATWKAEQPEAPSVIINGDVAVTGKLIPPVTQPMGDNKSGGQVTYYSVAVYEPSKGGLPYQAEAIDIIDALDMNFHEGEAFKSIWRCAADRHPGLQKAGNETVRDAQKVIYYGRQMERREKKRHGVK